jgi:hypothetical protein
MICIKEGSGFRAQGFRVLRQVSSQPLPTYAVNSIKKGLYSYPYMKPYLNGTVRRGGQNNEYRIKLKT